METSNEQPFSVDRPHNLHTENFFVFAVDLSLKRSADTSV